MTSVQERLQVNRTLLDKWSTREQLCLASAVACSGDQNWMSVSRTLKFVCGSTKDTLQTRPADWFSQKNCAVQYGHLLEDVETPKRKKRTSESSISLSPVAIDPPAEGMQRRLIDERMQEIKMELRKEQEEYAKLYAEIKAIQCGQMGDEQLLEMWKEVEKEQDLRRIQEMKLENQLRERELKKQELQRSWRTGTPSHSSTSNSLKSSTDTTAVDMDVEEIIGSAKTITQTCINTTQIQSATSPLLSSLLKCPTTGTPTIIAGPSSIRSTAPTITTLLTSGTIPNSNQPAIIPSRDDAVQLLKRPLSGPPLDTISSVTVAHLLSPSQSSPTLSMLLEKSNKINSSQNSLEIKNTELVPSPTNTLKSVENNVCNDSNNELVPMDIEEDIPAAKVDLTSNIQTTEVDDTDANEEQQLLEVFKNIGNIEELDIDVSDVIDEEVDFLKGVDEESPIDDNLELEQKFEENVTSDSNTDIKIKREKSPSIDFAPSDSGKSSTQISTDVKLECGGTKVEIISSDDSNDNIPLAAVASLESSKDRLHLNDSSNEEDFLKDQVESAILKNDQDQVELVNDSTSINSVVVKQEMLEENEKYHIEEDDDCNMQSSMTVNNDDVFAVPSTEEEKQENLLKSEIEDSQEIEDNPSNHKDIKNEDQYLDEMNVDSTNVGDKNENNELQFSRTLSAELNNEKNESLTSVKLQPPPSILIADTDENSSSTDISVQTRKDEKQNTNKGQQQRKSPQETKTDDEMPNPSPQMATPNINLTSSNLTPRPTALRKLRERDRSESPMIDDDATTHSDHSTTNQRSRRRYSSTPVIDSIPNSPASSDRDERDLKTSKKCLLSVYNVLYSSKYSPTLQRVLNDESSLHKLEEICLRSMDFITIKKNIETGLIRTVYELQKDILWMCQNALMITKTSSASYKTILAFQQECQNIREFMANGCEHGQKFERENRETKSNSSTSSSTGGSTSKGRSGSRKSLRLS